MMSGNFTCLSTNNEEFFSCDVPFDNQTCHIVPNDLPISINIWNSCNDLFHTEVIGIFNGGLVMAENVTVTVPINQQDQEVQISGQITDCNNNPVQNGAVAVLYGSSERLAVDLDQGNYELTFRRCNSITNLELIGYDLDNKLSAQLELELSDNVEIINQDLSVCDTPIESIFTLSSPNNQVILNNCVAIVSGTETLIRAKVGPDDSSEFILLGFQGFTTGDFFGNLITNATTSEAMIGVRDRSRITIDEYGSIGSSIRGSFSEGDITGQFIAQRIR